MKITIHYSTKIGTIKLAFNKMFPYLKIEFFKEAYAAGEAMSRSNMMLHNRYVGEINAALKEGSISFNADGRAGSIEQLFQQHFGLSVQVFRKQKKNTWIQTSNADECTLYQLNEMGRKSCALSIYDDNGERHPGNGRF